MNAADHGRHSWAWQGQSGRGAARLGQAGLGPVRQARLAIVDGGWLGINSPAGGRALDAAA